MARAADVELDIDDFQRIGDKTPYLADLKCVDVYGQDCIEDMHSIDLRESITWKTYIKSEASQRYLSIC